MDETTNKVSTYHTVIEASNPWRPIDWSELKRYKDFFYFKILNGYKAQQKQTIFGYFWVVFDPAFSILFFSVVFGAVAQINTGDIPYVAFNASAVLGWSYFNMCLNAAVGSMIVESRLIQKVYFPRLFIPLIPSIIQLPNLALNFVITLILLASFGYYPTVSVLAIVPITVIMIMICTGAGLLLSTIQLQFRDFGKFWGYFMRGFAYSVPIVYPISLVPEKYLQLYMLNPIVPLIEGYRNALLGLPIPWPYIGISFVFGALLLYIGAVFFRYREPTIVDAL